MIKRKSYVIAAIVMIVAVLGMTGVYLVQQKNKEEQKEEQFLAQVPSKEPQQQLEQEEPVNQVVEPENKDFMDSPNPELDALREEEEKQAQEAQVSTVVEPEVELHFAGILVPPVNGEVLMNYSMDKTEYFQTLDQYKYNPAVILKANVDDEVVAAAAGKVIDITTDAETGYTVTMDLGDGYQIIYGQLKELQCEKGQVLKRGQAIGYVTQPTKYYSLEGTNLYFEMKKDGASVNPLDYYEE